MLIPEHCWITAVLILQLCQRVPWIFLIKAGMQLLNVGRLEVAKLGKDGINSFVGRGQAMGSEAHDRSISPTALQFVVWLSLPFIGHGLTRWPTGEWWAKAWSISLGSNEAGVTASLGCLRGTNAFITVVHFGGWATILRFFSYFIYFGDSRRINEMLKFTGSISCRAGNWRTFF